MTRFFSLLAVLLLLPLSVAFGQSNQKLRHTALFDEFVDGEKRDSSSAEAQIISDLLDKGIVFIDEAQSRKIRSVTDAGTLIGGQISEVITALDADVIIAGICKITLIAKNVMGQPLIRYDADIQAKVIAVDTGEVLGAFNVRGEAMDFNAEQSAMKAARAAASELTAKVLASLEKRAAGPRRVEISIVGMTNVLAVETIKKTLGQSEGVTSVQVLQAGRGATKMSVEVTTMTSGELAVALQSIPELGLEVWGYSDRSIKADYSPASALDLPLIVASFENKTKSRRYSWAGNALAEVFQIELADAEYLAGVDQDKPAPTKDDKASLKKLAKKYKVPPGKTLVALGSYSLEKGKIRLEARIVVAGTGKALRSGQAVCEPEDLSNCAVKVAQDFSANLLQDITKKQKLFGAGLSKKTLKMVAAGGGAHKPLEIAAVDLTNIFPARLGRYAKEPIGTVKLKNRGEETLENLVVSTHLNGFMTSALENQAGNLETGQELEVPVKVILDAKALALLDENQPAMLTVKFTYRLGEYQVEQTTSRSVMVYDRNSITWSEPESLAAFVTPKDEAIRQFTSLAVGDKITPQIRNNPVFFPLQFHELLRAGGLKYVSDAVNPFGEEELDYVQFPVETLSRGAGDCDDLAVLYAALAESVGKEAALILTPGHVLVAINSGIPIQDAQRIAVNPDHYLSYNGTAWVPIESTLTTVPFEKAWLAGADQVAKWKSAPEKVTIVRVRDAWQAYPPVNLSGNPQVDAAKWSNGAKNLDPIPRLTAIETARQKAFDSELARLDSALKAAGKPDAGLLKAKGILLAREGRLDEAKAVFKQCGDAGDQVASWNNLGNLQARAGKLDNSLDLYKKAINKAPKNAQLHANAGMIYFVVDKHDDALEHFVACIDLGAEHEIARLGELGLGAGGGAKGAEGGGVASAPMLTELALKAFKKSGKEPHKSLKDAGKKKASEGGTGSVDQLYQHLYWL